jgi:hypothetical protein
VSITLGLVSILGGKAIPANPHYWVQAMTDDAKTQSLLNAVRREQYKNQLCLLDQQTLDERAHRYFEIEHQGIIGNHHFAIASSECIQLYQDGHFISAVMASQAVNEGIIKFIADRNQIAHHICQPPLGIKGLLLRLLGLTPQVRARTKSVSKLVEEIRCGGIISSSCTEAMQRIIRSFRNDVHHMNPKVAIIPFDTLAKRNLQDLASIEKEIFGVDYENGKLLPKQPKYWDIQENGTVPVFLRLGA